ncbi:hypothetical protein F442_17182 [Phytophthora nicotianae P10297]|uniref:Uncharacterized protein n=1 Tax=Phytophthora nicotianae P10297 TaxID=1317064 RepID=W2YHT9_PHYNI|nr:hypothetical protein F442_17182 [Phytophthora nicotianae P10297]
MDEKTLIKTMHVVMATIVFHNLVLVLNDDTQTTSFVETSENEMVDERYTADATIFCKVGKEKRNGIADIIC